MILYRAVVRDGPRSALTSEQRNKTNGFQSCLLNCPNGFFVQIPEIRKNIRHQRRHGDAAKTGMNMFESDPR